MEKDFTFIIAQKLRVILNREITTTTASVNRFFFSILLSLWLVAGRADGKVLHFGTS